MFYLFHTIYLIYTVSADMYDIALGVISFPGTEVPGGFSLSVCLAMC